MSSAIQSDVTSQDRTLDLLVSGFYDDPAEAYRRLRDEFDIGRATKHLAFGFGTHFCLGAHLAQLEVRVMLQEILARFPDIAPDGDVNYSPTAFASDISHLPVRCTPPDGQRPTALATIDVSQNGGGPQ